MKDTVGGVDVTRLGKAVRLKPALCEMLAGNDMLSEKLKLRSVRHRPLKEV